MERAAADFESQFGSHWGENEQEELQNELDRLFGNCSNARNAVYGPEECAAILKLAVPRYVWDITKEPIDNIHAAYKQESMRLVHEYANTQSKAAQTNAIAWAVMVIDNLHINSTDTYQISPAADTVYKGVKNTLRIRYKNETGIDPAPRYPIHTQLITEPNTGKKS